MEDIGLEVRASVSDGHQEIGHALKCTNHVVILQIQEECGGKCNKLLKARSLSRNKLVEDLNDVQVAEKFSSRDKKHFNANW